MFGEELKRLRKSRGLTQTELAERLNVSQPTIASWESGVRRPDVDALPTIARFFGVTVSDIYGEDAPPDGLGDEVWTLREQLRRNPDMRLLFSTATKASPEHLRAAAAMLKALEPQEDEG